MHYWLEITALLGTSIQGQQHFRVAIQKDKSNMAIDIQNRQVIEISISILAFPFLI